MYATKQRTRGQSARREICPKTLNPRQKKSAKKRRANFFPLLHTLQTPTDYFTLYYSKERDIYICSLSYSLSLVLSLSVLISSVSKLSLCVYSCFGLESALSFRVLKKRDSHIIRISYTSEWEERFGLDRPRTKKEFRSGWKEGENWRERKSVKENKKWPHH